MNQSEEEKIVCLLRKKYFEKIKSTFTNWTLAVHDFVFVFGLCFECVVKHLLQIKFRRWVHLPVRFSTFSRYNVLSGHFSGWYSCTTASDLPSLTYYKALKCAFPAAA